jgi:phosphoribosylaminoimidazole-succinocarboxamide synthase
VRRVDIYREPGTVPRDGEWVFVPLEVVCRHHLAGSGWRRYKRGELSAEELGFDAGTELEQGAKLPMPYIEITTKFESYDRLIDREEALEISNITGDELDSLLDVVIKVDALIEREAALRGLIHVDGKKEFALGPGRVPVLVDSFGTLDEDRWWDAEEFAKGNIVQLSKEFVRQHYIGTGHQEELRIARESGTEDPPIPALPQQVIDDTAELYASMYERLTGTEF